MKSFLIYFLLMNAILSVNVMAEKPYHHVYENGKFNESKNGMRLKFYRQK